MSLNILITFSVLSRRNTKQQKEFTMHALQKQRDTRNKQKKACGRFEMGVEWRISVSSRNEALVLMRSQLHRAVDLGSQHATEIHQAHALSKPRQSGNT